MLTNGYPSKYTAQCLPCPAMPLAPMPLLASKDDCIVNVICMYWWQFCSEKRYDLPIRRTQYSVPAVLNANSSQQMRWLPLCPSLLRPRPKALHKPGHERDFVQLHPIPLGRGSNAERACLKKEICEILVNVQESNKFLVIRWLCAFSPPRGDKKGE